MDHSQKRARETEPTPKITAFFAQLPKRLKTGETASGDGHLTLQTSPAADATDKTPQQLKHKTGYNAQWEIQHPWVFHIKDQGMYCKLCQKFDARNRQNQSRVWNKEACTTIRKDVLMRHEASAMHKEALEQERACQLVKARGGIRESVDHQVHLQRNAVEGALKCVYWLCKQEIPHTTNYQPLLSLAKNLGCSFLSALNVAKNAHYTSERIVQEILETLANQIENKQLGSLLNSRFYALMIDESTDVSVTKQLVIYGRYISEEGRPCTTFLKVQDLLDGTAARIEEALRFYLNEKKLPFCNLMGFGSDGAAVMTGRRSGIATRLRQYNPFLVAVHCAAHRLALACSQAGEKVPYVKKFKKSLSTLYWFFQASAVRTAGLKAVQEVLDDPSLKLKEAKDVRWLSHDLAVQTLRKTLPAVLTALEREGSEHGEPVALGLVKSMKCYNFFACLYMMSEVLPHLSRLPRLFQSSDIDLAMVKPSVQVCVNALSSYHSSEAKDVVAAHSALADNLKVFSITLSPKCKENFNTNVRQPFLQGLKTNVEDRFAQVEILDAFSVFDPSFYSVNSASTPDAAALNATTKGKEKLTVLVSHYAALVMMFL